MPLPFPPKRWTVLVYMGADDDNDAAMVRSAFADIEEMRAVGSSDHVNMAVQLDLRLFPPVRFMINRDGTVDDRPAQELGVLRESSTGRPRTLDKFLEWARRIVPAEHYLLILWGHGLGVGHFVEEATPPSRADVVYDADDGLTVRELAGVLRRFRDANNGRPIDLLGFDACFMNGAELAYELRAATEFIVGSQIVIPFEGWPYKPALKFLRTRPRTRPEVLASQLVQAFIDSYPREQTVTQTAMRPPAAGDLATAMQHLVAALDNASRDGREARKIGRAFRSATFFQARQFVDLKDLCRCLRTTCRDLHVKATARAAASLLGPGRGGFIVKHRRKGRETRALNGACVYAHWLKARSPDLDVKLELKEYKRLEFVRDTGWQDLNSRLKRLMNRGLL